MRSLYGRRQEAPVEETIKELVSKMRDTPEKYTGLKISYTRGHALSGMIQFSLTLNGTYSLIYDFPHEADQSRFSGTLTASERDVLLNSIYSNHVLEIPSSTSIAPEDEIPVVIELIYLKLKYQIILWKMEEPENSRLLKFQADLQTLFDKISSGKVKIASI
jgi:hypothetical protein